MHGLKVRRLSSIAILCAALHLAGASVSLAGDASAAKGKSRSARRPKPPNQGVYVPYQGAGSRDCVGDKTLVPLVPTELSDQASMMGAKLSTGGFTTQSHPSFWFHVPFTTDELKTLEFILQSRERTIFRSMTAIPQQPGLVKISLPQEASGLEVGQSYRWILEATIVCGMTAQSETLSVKGWVEQYRPTASLVEQLAESTLLKQTESYQSAGFWFDAVNLLGSLKLEHGQDPVTEESWQKLLNQYSIQF